MSFDATRQRLADGGGPPLGMFRICRGNPCAYIGGTESSNKKGLPSQQVSAFAFADVASAVPPVGIASVPSQVAANTYWPWKVMMGSLILPL